MIATAELLISDCPDIQVPAALLLLDDAETLPSGNAPVSRGFTAGDTTTVRPYLNRNASMGDLVGRYGGGGYAIATGLELSVPGSGLSLPVAAGHALIDGVVEVPAATTVVVANGARSWIWLKQNGTLTAVTTSTTPPAGACCLLGSCLASGGNITSVDGSGVLYIRGGILYRESGDIGLPPDTPPAATCFLHRSAGGLWLWDGTAYEPVGDQADGYANITGSLADANYTLLSTQYRCRILRFGWSGWTTGRNAIVPLTPGAWWWVINAAGQTVTVIGATGSGIAIANGKTASVWCNGTNVLRMTADNP